MSGVWRGKPGFDSGSDSSPLFARELVVVTVIKANVPPHAPVDAPMPT
jgi:hypothetical protein